MIKATLIVLLLSMMPVFGQTQSTMTIKVFFHNEKFNPNQIDCTKVFPTPRTIPKTKAVARAALEELLKGVTPEEEKSEFGSFPPENTRGIVQNLNVKGGVAYVNFNKTVYEKLRNTTSSCGSGFYSTIDATLMQFPTIKKVVYAIEGSTNDFYDWQQVGECPHGKKLCARSNFR
jgi:spore germination protein GerM